VNGHNLLGGRRSARQTLLAERARDVVWARRDLGDSQRAAAADADEEGRHPFHGLGGAKRGARLPLN